MGRKVNILKRVYKEGGEVPLSDKPVQPQDQVREQSETRQVPLASHISTMHTDPFRYKISTFEDMRKNTVFPNKFRVRARVRSIHSRAYQPAGKEEDYTTHFCVDCQKPQVSRLSR